MKPPDRIIICPGYRAELNVETVNGGIYMLSARIEPDHMSRGYIIEDPHTNVHVKPLTTYVAPKVDPAERLGIVLTDDPAPTTDPGTDLSSAHPMLGGYPVMIGDLLTAESVDDPNVWIEFHVGGIVWSTGDAVNRPGWVVTAIDSEDLPYEWMVDECRRVVPDDVPNVLVSMMRDDRIGALLMYIGDAVKSMAARHDGKPMPSRPEHVHMSSDQLANMLRHAARELYDLQLEGRGMGKEQGQG